MPSLPGIQAIKSDLGTCRIFDLQKAETIIWTEVQRFLSLGAAECRGKLISLKPSPRAEQHFLRSYPRSCDQNHLQDNIFLA